MKDADLTVLVGELVQSELDKRMDSLIDERQYLPFGGISVVSVNDVYSILIKNFTNTIQTELRKRLDKE